MEQKIKHCRICGETKSLDMFGNLKNMKDGHQSVCKDCFNQKARAYNALPEANKKKRELDKIYRNENREVLSKKRNEWNKITGYRKTQRSREYSAKYRKTPRQKEYRKEYNKLYWKIRQAKIWELNPPPPPLTEKEIEEKNNYLRLKTRLILQVKKGLKRQDATKHYKSIELIGCSYTELMKYLESKFEEGMTWGNRGYYGWHIDHIKPLSLFNLRDKEQQKLAFNYTNLQPLWWMDNLLKSNKILVA